MCHGTNMVLGLRLRKITTEEFQENTAKSAIAILGEMDTQKVRSCMTLFDSISPNDIFSDVLNSLYNGERDPNKTV